MIIDIFFYSSKPLVYKNNNNSFAANLIYDDVDDDDEKVYCTSIKAYVSNKCSQRISFFFLLLKVVEELDGLVAV